MTSSYEDLENALLERTGQLAEANAKLAEMQAKFLTSFDNDELKAKLAQCDAARLLFAKEARDFRDKLTRNPKCGHLMAERGLGDCVFIGDFCVRCGSSKLEAEATTGKCVVNICLACEREKAKCEEAEAAQLIACEQGFIEERKRIRALALREAADECDGEQVDGHGHRKENIATWNEAVCHCADQINKIDPSAAQSLAQFESEALAKGIEMAVSKLEQSTGPRNEYSWLRTYAQELRASAANREGEK